MQEPTRWQDQNANTQERLFHSAMNQEALARLRSLCLSCILAHALLP